MIPSDCHRPYFVPREDVERRVAALQAALRKQEIAVAWIEHLADRLYFSGSPQDGVLLVPAAGPPVFHVRKSLTRAAEEAGVATERYPGGKAMIAAAWNAAGPGGRIGLALDATPATILLRLQHAGDPERIADLTATVRTIRSVKSPWEIEQIEKASDQVTTMYAGIFEEIRPGITELELTGRVEGSLRASGHGGTVRVRRFGTDISMGVVVSGVSALHPTSFNGPVGAEGPYPPSASGAGWRRLAEGETVMLDIVTSYNGYHADTTRTFFLGDDPPAKALAGHQFCRDVLGEIEKRLCPAPSVPRSTARCCRSPRSAASHRGSWVSARTA